MNELLELLESTKNSVIEVSVPLTNVIEECLVEVKHSDNFTISGIFEVSNYIISWYAVATGSTYLNTVDNSQILALKNVLDDVDLMSIVESTEREFELFCKKAFDLISWYIETIPY